MKKIIQSAAVLSLLFASSEAVNLRHHHHDDKNATKSFISDETLQKRISTEQKNVQALQQELLQARVELETDETVLLRRTSEAEPEKDGKKSLAQVGESEEEIRSAI